MPYSMLSIPIGHAAGQGTTGIYSPLLPETGASSVPPAPLKLSSLAPPSFLWLACRHQSGSLRGAGNHAARDQRERRGLKTLARERRNVESATVRRSSWPISGLAKAPELGVCSEKPTNGQGFADTGVP